MRIQKVLAASGHGSRRTIEQWIKEGAITVNGLPAQLGQCVDGTEHIHIHGKRVRYTLPEHQTIKLLMLHKPVGWLCSHVSQDDRPTIYQMLPKLHRGRWLSAGRLDINSSGLLLLTNHGPLAHLLMHPRSHLERCYHVRAFGKLELQQTNPFLEGMVIDQDVCCMTTFEIMSQSGMNGKYQVSIQQGKNRIVRKMFEAQGLKVNRLKRVSHGPFQLPEALPPGKCIEVSEGVWRQKLSRLIHKYGLK